MRFLVLALFAIYNLNINSSDHDSISATFNVIDKGHVLMLEVDFDTFDFLKLDAAKSITVTKEDFSNYLNKTTSWEFDGKQLTPQVLSIKPTGHHTKVICFLSKSIKNIKKVVIKNEFLVNVKAHSNIVALDINNTFKDFRLHKERREIKVDYSKK